MFPCQFKIPGHSGTDFKHRKAFKKAKELQDKRKRVSAAITKNNFEPGYSKNIANSLLAKWMKAGLFFSAVVLSLIFVENQADNISTQLKEYKTKSEIIRAENIINVYTRAYKVLTTTGNDYLYWNMLDEAQSEFALALKIDKNGKAANLGMTKTLMKKCAQRSEYCAEAKAYLDYMKSLGEALDNELIELEGMVVFE